MLNHTLAEFSSDCPIVKTGCTMAWKRHTAWKPCKCGRKGIFRCLTRYFILFFVRKTIKEVRGIQNTFHGKLLKKLLCWVGIIVSLEVILRHICNHLSWDHNPNSLRKGRKKITYILWKFNKSHTIFMCLWRKTGEKKLQKFVTFKPLVFLQNYCYDQAYMKYYSNLRNNSTSGKWYIQTIVYR